MLPLFDAGYINMSRQYLTIGVNGLVEAAQFMGIDINDNQMCIRDRSNGVPPPMAKLSNASPVVSGDNCCACL